MLLSIYAGFKVYQLNQSLSDLFQYITSCLELIATILLSCIVYKQSERFHNEDKNNHVIDEFLNQSLKLAAGLQKIDKHFRKSSHHQNEKEEYVKTINDLVIADLACDFLIKMMCKEELKNNYKDIHEDMKKILEVEKYDDFVKVSNLTKDVIEKIKKLYQDVLSNDF